MTIGEETTKEDMDYVVDNIKEIVTKLRTMSPLYEDFVKKIIKRFSIEENNENKISVEFIDKIRRNHNVQ